MFSRLLNQRKFVILGRFHLLRISSHFQKLMMGLNGKSELTPITAEDVRKRLEKVYPELTKKDSIINYIEKKDIIVPSMMAKKKGAVPMSSLFFSVRNEKLEPRHSAIPVFLMLMWDVFFILMSQALIIFSFSSFGVLHPIHVSHVHR